MAAKRRGLFYVFEGIDRCGKTTQIELMQHAWHDSCVTAMRFPKRETAIGRMLDNYLRSVVDLDDQCAHLLFSANRWEQASEIRDMLAAGQSVLCDRYAFSGVAFSAAKGLDMDWCIAPDRGLPRPDLVLFLDMAPEDAMSRGAYGDERFETLGVQRAVRAQYDRLADLEGDRWVRIDAAQSIAVVHDAIKVAIRTAMRGPAHESPTDDLWKK